MPSTTTDNSLRKVAILVASLDETWAERVLDSLPPHQARAVRQQVDELTEIDPDEQRKIVDDFRRNLAQPSESQSNGVELDASLLERIDHQDYAAPAVQQPSGPLDSLSTDDVDLLAAMLGHESPQTVAVILARLDADRAAEVLNKLPAGQQNEILERLADLDTADDQTVRVVEAQVAQWLAGQRQRRERMAAGKQMVERLMSRQGAITSGSAVNGRMPRSTAGVAREYAQLSTRCSQLPPPVRYEPLPAAIPAAPAAPANPLAHLSADACIARLEALPDQILLGALSKCESRVALLALMGASEKLVKRVTRGLSRQENRLFRQQLRDTGPTRLSDILAAQQEVLSAAGQND